MSAGPLGGRELRRELSPCTMAEIDKVAMELFQESCLLTRREMEDKINHNRQIGSNFEILNQNCDVG